ncbi:MAG TPA: Spy/CpxP family protein refolding chaperone [Thermoanaerobaculia bacterium]|nr:Spy/CpxP family protein refolding chaperone [Thermoanaerobaculia bacterium]
MMRRRLSVATALVAVLALPLLAEAARRPGNPGDVLRNPRALARYLKLTPAQLETTKQLVKTLHDTTKPLYEQIEPLAEQRRSQLDEASPDACSVGNTVVQIDGLRDQIRGARGDFDEAFSAILTPEQLAKYEALKDAAKIGEEEDE